MHLHGLTVLVAQGDIFEVSMTVDRDCAELIDAGAGRQ